MRVLSSLGHCVSGCEVSEVSWGHCLHSVCKASELFYVLGPNVSSPSSWSPVAQNEVAEEFVFLFVSV